MARAAHIDQQGYILHTASGESSLDLTGYLQRMGVPHCFGRLYGPNLIDTFKEGPEYYERIFADLGISATNAVVVDDNPRAISWAAQVGAQTVFVSYSSASEKSATVQISSLKELPTIIHQLD
jgi:phosphoglycolate phosphatase-like HAD superfamily hydrolase